MRLTRKKLKELIKEELGSYVTNGSSNKQKVQRAYEAGKEDGINDLENEEWIDTHTAGTIFDKMVEAGLDHHDLVHKGMGESLIERIRNAYAKGYLAAKEEFID